MVDRLPFAERSLIIDLATESGLERGLIVHAIALEQGEWKAVEERERLLAREVARDGIDL